MSLKLRLVLVILVQVLFCTINAEDYSEDDGTDATLQVSLTPSGHTSFTRGSKLEIVCRASSNKDDIEILIFKDKKRVRSSESDFSEENGYTTKTIKYEVASFENDNVGTYLCRAYVNKRKHYEEAEVTIRVFNTPQVTAQAICEKRCTNGRCVLNRQLCDGFDDCGDNSDEQMCYASSSGSNKICEPTQDTCSDGKTCKEKHWFCDGENDCLDGSDERMCPSRRPSDVCESTQFACSNRNQCISKAFVCDRSQDCPDNSDEIGCTAPKVTNPPVRTLEVCEGETITLKCAAKGFPIPFINWRLNWGHVCEKPRCTMANNDGSGVLTILRAQISDSGAYSCEAINNQGREIYAIDAIVTVRQCSTPAPVCRGYYHNGKCISCFCNGLNDVSCRGASHLVYNGQYEDFLNVFHDWEIKEYKTNNVATSVNTNTKIGFFEYTGESASYGGELRFNIYYEGERTDEDSMKLEVRISGSKIALIYVHNRPIYPFEETTVVIPLVEESFVQFENEAPVTRDHFLMALSNVDLVMISASFVADQQSASISKFSFDIAKECNDSRKLIQKKADLVEICLCPSKYKGTSCEDCNRGFTKGNLGTYLGICELDCNEFCHGNSNNCDERRCYNCQSNTTGDKCEECARGYSGNAKTGKCYRKNP